MRNMSQLIKVKEEILKCVADTVKGTALWDTVSHTVDEIRIAYFFIYFTISVTVQKVWVSAFF